MRYVALITLLFGIQSLFALTPQELAMYRNRMAERIFKDIPAVMPNLQQRVERVEIPTNKEVHYAYADSVIANLLPPTELQILLNLPAFKGTPGRAFIFGGQPESVRVLLETIVNWLSQLNRLRFEGKQYQSNYVNELVFFAPYAQAVITDPDDWQTFVDQLKKYEPVIRSAQFLKEHQDLKPKNIQFALSLLTAPAMDMSMFAARLQEIQDKIATLQKQMAK